LDNLVPRILDVAAFGRLITQGEFDPDNETSVISQLANQLNPDVNVSARERFLNEVRDEIRGLAATPLDTLEEHFVTRP
jgi:hypothetical protein